LKHSANRPILKNKRVILVDDSIVRGTTSKKIVEMVRAAGASEVHLRISSPPTTHSCFYGIDTPDRSQLLAASHDVDQMARLIGVDSLAFVSIDGCTGRLAKRGVTLKSRSIAMLALPEIIPSPCQIRRITPTGN
jgi:amidophosphoribosyltransferase